MAGHLKVYRVLIGGIEHHFQLDAAEAERRGLGPGDLVHPAGAETGEAKLGAEPANKARTAANKAL